MGFEIPEVEPTVIRAGETVTWKKTLDDYPAPTWTLTYYLLNSSGKITITAVADGTNHSVDVDESVSAAWTAGIYKWTSRVTDGTDVRTVDYGTVEIEADVAVISTLDTRSNNKKLLDAVRAVISGRVTKELAAYQIGGRSITRLSPTELLEIEDKLVARVAAEERVELARQGKEHSKIRARFSKG